MPTGDNPKRDLLRAIGSGVVCWVTLNVLLTAWVHHAFEGRWDGPFLISERFGVPEAEADRGVRPVLPEEIPGWDGQFYFHAAQDPLGRTDAADHMDNAAYRYQRIGVPAMAWLAARAGGHGWTPAWVYHQTQIVVISLGLAVLAFWLLRSGVSPWFALTWVGACGPLYAFSHGLPDAAADALFIAALAAACFRNLGMYAVAMTLLVLTREGYVVVAFPVWCLSVAGLLPWGDRGLPARFILTALPGAALVAWTGYLWLHFGDGLFSSERSPAGLYDWPFAAFADTVRGRFLASDPAGVAYPLLSAATIVVVAVAGLREARRSWLGICLLPYLLLTASLGDIVWSGPEGYMKAAGSVIVIGLFLLPADKGLLLKFILAANLVAGLHWNLVRNVVASGWYSPNMSLVSVDEGAANPAPVEQFHAPVEWLDESPELTLDAPDVWRFVHREAVPLRVRVTNATASAWPGGTEVGYVLFDAEGRVTGSHHVGVGEDWPAGESREMTVWVRLGKPGYYLLQLSVYRDAEGWFFQRDDRCGGRYPVRVY